MIDPIQVVEDLLLALAKPEDSDVATGAIILAHLWLAQAQEGVGGEEEAR